LRIFCCNCLLMGDVDHVLIDSFVSGLIFFLVLFLLFFFISFPLCCTDFFLGYLIKGYAFVMFFFSFFFF
jgi:hypothetical protein